MGEFAEALLKVIVGLVVVVLTTAFLVLVKFPIALYRSYFIHIVWNWFAPILMLPVLTFWQVVALDMLRRMVFVHMTAKKKEIDWGHHLGTMIIFYPFSLLIAWIIRAYFLV